MEANKFITNESENMLTQMNSKRIMTDDELKNIFGEGKDPTHVDFECLIDSKANVQDVYTKKYLQEVMEAYYGSSPEIAKEWHDKEMERRTNEDARKSQELIRQSQEIERVEAENTRVIKMTENQNRFDTYELTMNSKIEDMDNKTSDFTNLKTEIIKVKDDTLAIKDDTLSVKSETETVKNDTLQVKKETIEVKDATNVVRNNTESVRVATDLVKIQAENKIVDCESRMSAIENEFDSLVNGTGFATITYVDTELSKKANVGDSYLKSETYSQAEINNRINQVVASLDWKESVNTFNELVTIYPDAQDGWTVNVKDTDITYRYSGTQWISISANSIPLASQNVDGKMSKEDKVKLDGLANNYAAKIHTHSMSDITGLSLEAGAVNYNKNGYAKVDGALDKLFEDNEVNKTSILELVENVKDLSLEVNGQKTKVTSIAKELKSLLF